MEKLIQNYQRLFIENKPKYHRKFYDDFKMTFRFMGIIGARGVGKTTFLIHYLRHNFKNSKQALYVSADNIYFSENNLLDLVDKFINFYNGKILCIDEIHKYKNWQQELKNIYDSYQNIKIIFSGSSSLDLIQGKYDLSRRVILKIMYGFSFREYLEIKTQKKFPVLKLEKLLNSPNLNLKISHTKQILGHFKEYLKRFYYPASLEIDSYEVFQETLFNVIEKTIFEDISSYYRLKTQNLDIFKKIIYFLATTAPGSFSINKLAKSLKKDHTTISDYIQILKNTGLLIFLLNNQHGHSLVRNAEKIYISNTNLLFAINNAIGKEVNIGTMREIFVISSLIKAGYQVFYSKNGDISCLDQIFEIGGASKTKKQIKNLEKAYLIKDDILYQDKNIIPMYLFGFLN